ncbi:MAG: hypothetical protein WCV84_04910 [Patescibacteria group bacterium]
MSNPSYKNYTSYGSVAEHLASTDEKKRQEAEKARAKRMAASARSASVEAPRAHAKARVERKEPIDLSLACNELTTPPPKVATECHLALVDNSGSNEEIARSLRTGSGYLMAIYEILASLGAFGTVFFSDHCDGARLFQDVGWVMPGERGAKILEASIAKVQPAGGGDAPEAIECALKRAAELDFGHIEKRSRHLYLVTDEVAHNMGYPRSEDDGCPHQVSWRRSLELVHETFGTFQVIASGCDRKTFELQKQFIAPERRRFDLMDFATSRLSDEERCRLVANGLLFQVAKNRGQQTVGAFLMTLAEKWLAEPQYGCNTVARARSQIRDFIDYLDITEEARARLLERIFAGVE